MRILEFSDSFIPIMDGVGNVVYQYAMNMGKKGHECYVIAPQTDTGYRGGYPFELVDYMGVQLSSMKSYTVGVPNLDPHCQSRLNMISGDIVHVHSPFVAGQAGLLYASRHNLPTVGTFHSKYRDDFLQATGITLLADAGTRFVVDFFEKCTEVWAVSESSAETLREYGFKNEIKVMPNGTDIHPLTDAGVLAANEQFPTPEGVPLLLYTGQINWKKNLRTTLQACAILAKAHPEKDFRLMLAGQGPHEEEIKKLAEELGIGEKVIFTGHLTDHDLLNALYARASLFLFPSLYDTSGLVTREAAAMGTPSIVVKGSSAAEGMTDGINGFLCENDPADLARTIEDALSDPKRLESIGQKAKETIPIPWSTLVDNVLDEYRNVIRKYHL
ncbi:MAG: glycosyltransferase [Firmicutes bacterium]|nr:glycosyltransferase [Bacillota bacterium]